MYAVDYNHKKERHLDGTVLHKDGVVLDALSRPTLMITDTYNSLISHPARKHRDAALFGKLANIPIRDYITGLSFIIINFDIF